MFLLRGLPCSVNQGGNSVANRTSLEGSGLGPAVCREQGSAGALRDVPGLCAWARAFLPDEILCEPPVLMGLCMLKTIR